MASIVDGGTRTPATIETATRYVERVKKAFSDQPEAYDAFIVIMNHIRTDQIETVAAIERLGVLFQGNPTLIPGINDFLPQGYYIGCSIALTIMSPGAAKRKTVDITPTTVSKPWVQLLPTPAPVPTVMSCPTALCTTTTTQAASEKQELIISQTSLSQENAQSATLEGNLKEVDYLARYRSLEEKYQNSELKVKELDQKVEELDQIVKKAAECQRTADARIAELEESTGKLTASLANVKSAKGILSQRVRELKDKETANIQKSIIEHAHIHILVRLLSVAKDDFASSRISLEEIVQACDNLEEQLKEVAARQLEKVPLGYSSIEEVMRSRTRTWEDVVKEEEEDGAIVAGPKRPRV